MVDKEEKNVLTANVVTVCPFRHSQKNF